MAGTAPSTTPSSPTGATVQSSDGLTTAQINDYSWGSATAPSAAPNQPAYRQPTNTFGAPSPGMVLTNGALRALPGNGTDTMPGTLGAVSDQLTGALGYARAQVVDGSTAPAAPWVNAILT